LRHLSTLLFTAPSFSSQQSDHNLELNCWVFGDDVNVNHIFTVKIASSETVAILKEVIKHKKQPAFDHFPADTLLLWMDSIPADNNFNSRLQGLELDEEGSLLPVDRLSAVFSDIPIGGHLHIIV
jgi:hypothetical protein